MTGMFVTFDSPRHMVLKPAQKTPPLRELPIALARHPANGHLKYSGWWQRADCESCSLLSAASWQYLAPNTLHYSPSATRMCSLPWESLSEARCFVKRCQVRDFSSEGAARLSTFPHRQGVKMPTDRVSDESERQSTPTTHLICVSGRRNCCSLDCHPSQVS